VLSVTVPVELLPPLTLVGFKVSEKRVTLEAGVMVREAFAGARPQRGSSHCRAGGNRRRGDGKRSTDAAGRDSDTAGHAGRSAVAGQ